MRNRNKLGIKTESVALRRYREPALSEEVPPQGRWAESGGARTLTFLAALVYFEVAISNTRDRQLLLNEPITMPFFNAGVSANSFYILVPVLLFIFHVDVLVRLNIISFGNRIVIDPVLPPVASSGVFRRGGITAFWPFLVPSIYLAALVILPLAILIDAQLQFLPARIDGISAFHRFIVAMDGFVVWLCLLPVFRVSVGDVHLRLKACVRVAIRISVVGAVLMSAYARVPESCGLKIIREVSRLDLSGEDISGARLIARDLRCANFSEAKLKAVDFRGVDLRQANFRLADLSHAKFNSGAFRGGELVRSRLDGATLEEAVLVGADLKGASLISVSLIQANMMGANLTEADLRSANLRGADLRAADLSFSSLRGANLTDVNASLSDFTSAHLENAGFNEAKLDGADFLHAAVEGAEFRNSSLEGSVALELFAVDLRGAELGGFSYRHETEAGNSLGSSPSARRRFFVESMLAVGPSLADFRGIDLSLREETWQKLSLEVKNMPVSFRGRAESRLERARKQMTLWPEAATANVLCDSHQVGIINSPCERRAPAQMDEDIFYDLLSRHLVEKACRSDAFLESLIMRLERFDIIPNPVLENALVKNLEQKVGWFDDAQSSFASGQLSSDCDPIVSSVVIRKFLKDFHDERSFGGIE